MWKGKWVPHKLKQRNLKIKKSGDNKKTSYSCYQDKNVQNE